nr:MAG TPA: hypothetical protein [Caudoviricetes sp.]
MLNSDRLILIPKSSVNAHNSCGLFLCPYLTFA